MNLLYCIHGQHGPVEMQYLIIKFTSSKETLLQLPETAQSGGGGPCFPVACACECLGCGRGVVRQVLDENRTSTASVFQEAKVAIQIGPSDCVD
jgi:hypothetical protein